MKFKNTIFGYDKEDVENKFNELIKNNNDKLLDKNYELSELQKINLDFKNKLNTEIKEKEKLQFLYNELLNENARLKAKLIQTKQEFDLSLDKKSKENKNIENTKRKYFI